MVFACTACCKNWFEGSHGHIRRHQCHVALSCFPKGYPMSHLSEVWDTEQHTICQDKQTSGLVIGRQHLWQPNWATCLYWLWHCERLRQSKEAECPGATKSDITYLETFSQVGQSWDVQPQLPEKVQQFTCRMYVAASSTTKVNDMRLCQKGRYWVQSSTTMHILSLRAPPSSQLSGSKLEVMSTCLSHIARPIDDGGKLDRHSRDAVATSTRCCLGIVCLQVCPFLQADTMYVHGK